MTCSWHPFAETIRLLQAWMSLVLVMSEGDEQCILLKLVCWCSSCSSRSALCTQGATSTTSPSSWARPTRRVRGCTPQCSGMSASCCGGQLPPPVVSVGVLTMPHWVLHTAGGSGWFATPRKLWTLPPQLTAVAQVRCSAVVVRPADTLSFLDASQRSLSIHLSSYLGGEQLHIFRQASGRLPTLKHSTPTLPKQGTFLCRRCTTCSGARY